MGSHGDHAVFPQSSAKPGPSTTNPNSESSGHPHLLNDSSSGTTPSPHDHYKGLVEDITQILCEKRGESQAHDKSYGHAFTINTLPDDVLLEIFDECRRSQDPDRPSALVWRWHRLVHVCQRWRQLVYGSPRHLDLQLLCTHGTPVRKNLGYWPPFPIVIHYNRDYVVRSNISGPTPNDEDSVFAALDHPDRVRYVDLCLIGPRSREMAMAMQEPFPALTHLTLQVDYGFGGLLSLPSGFLGGSAPRLQHMHLEGILFPELPTLLSSASGLVHLSLNDITQDGHISPEAMVSCLAALPRLKFLCIKYRSDTRPDRLRPPPVLRTVVPSLISFEFQGAGQYLEDLVARIDSPQLNQIYVKYLNQFPDFQVAQIFKFIDRSEDLDLTLIRHADVSFSHPWVTLKMYPRPESHPDWDRACASISCRAVEGQLPHIALVFGRPPALLSRVVHLKFFQYRSESSRYHNEWLHFLRRFPAVRTLYISRPFALHIVHALDGVIGQLVTELLPVLDLICLDGRLVSSVEKFLAARRLSGRPVTNVDTEAEFDERVNSYVSK